MILRKVIYLIPRGNYKLKKNRRLFGACCLLVCEGASWGC